MLGTVVVLGVAWVSAHVIFAEARPEPLARPSDFPALPRREDNGFELVARASPKPSQPPKTLPVLATKRAELPTWAQAETAAAETKAFVERADTKATLAILDVALDKPVFVDACADRSDHACSNVQALLALRIESYAILALAQEGQNEEATRRLGRLLRAEEGWLHSPRSFVSQRASLSAARSTLQLVALVGPRLSPDQRARLLPVVGAFAKRPVDLGWLVKITYLEDVALLDDVVRTSSGWHMVSPTSPPPPPTLYERFVSQRLLDRGRTERMLLERAKQTLRWAEKGDVPLPPPARYGESPLFWAYNPVGKMLLDGSISPTFWESTRDDARALVADAAALDLR